MSNAQQRRVGPASLIALATCLTLAACGGSSKKVPARDVFTQRADTICSAGAARMSALPQAKDPAQAAAVARRGRALIARYMARLEALKPPPARASQFNLYLAALRREIDNEDAIAAAARAGDASSVKSLQAARPGYVRHSHDLGRKLGLAHCYG